jgi:hypothetical protein
VKRQTAGTNVKEHWVEKVVYTTADAFPNILRQSEIVSAEAVRLSPIQTAIERTWRKTTELNILEKRASIGDDPNNSNLTATLLQLLDNTSSSGSCLALYRQLLPEPSKESQDDHVTADDASEETDTSTSDRFSLPRSSLQTALYVALSDHAAAIKHCLTLYARPSLQATRRDLYQRLDTVYPQEARLSTPPGPEHELSNHSDTHSSASGVHRPFVDPPNPNDQRTSTEYAKRESMNGRVISPDPSESGRVSRQDKPQRLSLQALRGAATSMQPDVNEPRRTNTVHSRTSTTHSTGTNPVSAPTPGQPNGIHIPESSIVMISLVNPGQSTDPTEKEDQSSRATSSAAKGAQPDKKRRSILADSTTSDAPEPVIVAPVQETSDQWGRSLKESLGANISTERFETHDEKNPQSQISGEEVARSVTSESENTNSTGKVKKRFSLIRLGMKKSGNSLSTKLDLDGVEEK